VSAVVSEMLNISSESPLSLAKIRANIAQAGKDTGPYQFIILGLTGAM
jgi:hypothetical protein